MNIRNIFVWGLCFVALAAAGCVQQSSVLAGKRLTLNNKHYYFVAGDAVSYTLRHEGSPLYTRYHHSYQPSTGEFYEESRVCSDSGCVHDGYGYTRWHLQFHTPTTGTATLVEHHVFYPPPVPKGQSVPFRITDIPTEE